MLHIRAVSGGIITTLQQDHTMIRNTPVDQSLTETIPVLLMECHGDFEGVLPHFIEGSSFIVTRF